LINKPISNLPPSIYFISAGEESADNHGATLMKAMLSLNPNLKFSGIGGNKMISVGLKSIENIEKLAVMGFVEVIRHLVFFYNLTKRILVEIDICKPQQIILIDYPGFNLWLVKKIKKQINIPITYYISPQIWAWKEKRIEIIRKYVDQMLVIFPFEENWYRERGIEAKFVGHPIFDEWTPSSKENLCNELTLKLNTPVVTLYPGSREQEVNRHLPILLQAAYQLRSENMDIQFILGVAKYINFENWNIPEWIYVEKQYPQKALECADLALVASGTSTVEAAVFGTPMIIIYKMSLLSWWLSKKLVKVPYVGMVNIIAGSMIMPEILQAEATASKIYKTAQEIIGSPKKMTQMKSDLSNVQNLLKGRENMQSAAKYILDMSDKA
jgi:lipid-A-disaccharide synthase